MFFFFNDTATTEIYTLSLHDALPISDDRHADDREHGARAIAPGGPPRQRKRGHRRTSAEAPRRSSVHDRSEEHTSELLSQSNIVCRLLLEKKKREGNHVVKEWLGCQQ